MSRYSIVERLTTMKLNLIDELHLIDVEIQNAENRLLQKKRNLEYLAKERQEQTDILLRNGKNDITDVEKDIQFQKETKGSREERIKEKVKELDNALEAIKKISETAPTPQEQS
jgi:hypothetical protein